MVVSRGSSAPLNTSIPNYAIPIDLPPFIFASAWVILSTENGVGTAVSSNALMSASRGIVS